MGISDKQRSILMTDMDGFETSPRLKENGVNFQG